MSDPIGIRRDVLRFAENAVCNERNANYGDPRKDFSQISILWSLILGVDVREHHVALCMIAVKMSRLLTNPQHADGWADIAGYAACGADVADADTSQLGAEYRGADVPKWERSDVRNGSPDDPNYDFGKWYVEALQKAREKGRQPIGRLDDWYEKTGEHRFRYSGDV